MKSTSSFTVSYFSLPSFLFSGFQIILRVFPLFLHPFPISILLFLPPFFTPSLLIPIPFPRLPPHPPSATYLSLSLLPVNLSPKLNVPPLSSLFPLLRSLISHPFPVWINKKTKDERKNEKKRRMRQGRNKEGGREEEKSQSSFVFPLNQSRAEVTHGDR